MQTRSAGCSPPLFKAMATTPRKFTAHVSPANLAAQRKRELGHIHQGRAFLQWSEEDYRYHLREITGKSSAADLDAPGRANVLARMAVLGFKPKDMFKPFDQAAKIKWLWRKLAEAGGVTDPSDRALMAFVARTAGMTVGDLKFLPVQQASTVIEALKSWLDRAKAKRASGT